MYCKKSLKIFVLFVIMIFVFLSPVYASDNMLSIYTNHDAIELQVYRISDEYKNFVGSFEECNFSLLQIDYELTTELFRYIDKNNIQPDIITYSKKNQAILTGLESGIYFISGREYSIDEISYLPVPVTIELTGSMEIYQKYSQTDGPLGSINPPLNNEEPPGLPQTGQDWDKVLIAAVLGMGFVIVSFRIKKNR